MAQSAAQDMPVTYTPAPNQASLDAGRIRIEDECLELNAANPQEADVLRTWVRRINGATYAQPYLVEDPPGHFCLYVGEAAERVRTARGIQ